MLSPLVILNMKKAMVTKITRDLRYQPERERERESEREREREEFHSLILDNNYRQRDGKIKKINSVVGYIVVPDRCLV